MSPDRHWIAPALYMAMIIALSSIPGSSGPETPPGPAGWIPPLVSNALHVPLYAGLGLLWTYALTHTNRLRPWPAAVTALVIGAAFGALDELYQGLIPGRTTSLGDWLADTAGAAIGGTLFLIRQQWRHRPKRPKRP